MQRNVSARAEAIKEMSREKARIFRKETKVPSPLEKVALAWKKKKEMEGRQQQKKTLKKEESLEPSFRETLAKGIVNYDKRKLAGETEWVQYSPWQKGKEEDKEKKQIPLNTATVVAIRKKLVAMEWARALGKRTKNTRFHDLEQEAVIWKQKREEEKGRKEKLRTRIKRHKEVLSDVLTEFGKSLREKKATAGSPEQSRGNSAEELSTLLEDLLENAGEVFDIEWQAHECLIWIEPWEEKKVRRISGLDIPVIYRVKIDENFEITSYEEVEGEAIIENLKNEILTKPLRESLKEVSFNIDDEEQAQQFLEDKLTDIGRLINLERTLSGWIATIEPWEEVRIRNIKRGSKPPIVTEKIEINWKDGKLEFEKGGKDE